MYTILHAGSLEQIQYTDASEHSHDGLSLVTGKKKRVRSKNGCYFCRSRKRKCDEQQPLCGLCVLKQLECVYPKANSAFRLSKKSVPRKKPRKNFESDPEIAIAMAEAISSDSLVLALKPLDSPLESLGKTPKLVEVDDDGHTLDQDLQNATEVLTGWSSPSFLIEPSTPFELRLDKRSLQFVSYFHKEVVKFVSISPLAIQNHLGNTYMSIAVEDDSILALLATWGALFMDGPNSDTYKDLLRKAKQLFNQKFEKDTLSDMDKFIMLCYHAGVAGLGICAGDTLDWHEQLRYCKRIISQFGLVRAFLEKFNYLNSARWIVANLQYHDVMSSISMKEGTLMDMADYAAVFEDDTDFSYGVDPLQGCIHPVFALLGEIINANAELQRERGAIERDLNALSGSSPSETETFHQLTHDRLQHYFKASRLACDLMARVEACEPKLNQQCFLAPSELDDHLTLFEAFRNTCKLHILMYIQGLHAKAPEIQVILMNTLKLADILVASELRPAISMVLLMCGLCSCYPADRAQIRRQFQEMQSHYRVYNVQKIEQIVEENWKVNPDGNLHITWSELCDKLGWVLSAS